MAHKPIRLFRNICSHTRPLDASISMFRPSERKSGENASGWGEFCEGCAAPFRRIIPQWLKTSYRDVNFDTPRISPVYPTEVANHSKFRSNASNVCTPLYIRIYLYIYIYVCVRKPRYFLRYNSVSVLVLLFLRRSVLHSGEC